MGSEQQQASPSSASSENDDSTIAACGIPTETAADSLDTASDVELSISTPPAPGTTYLIHSVSCGHFLKLFDGELVPGDQEGCSSHWFCMEAQGWLGFKNMASGKFLSCSIYGNQVDLSCTALMHRGSERVTVRPLRKESPVYSVTYVSLRMIRDALLSLCLRNEGPKQCVAIILQEQCQGRHGLGNSRGLTA